MPNSTQADSDGDQIGDACDSQDTDGDGLGDVDDACPGTSPGAAVNVDDGCSIAQSCPPTASWKNHGAYVSCVTAAAQELVDQNAITSAHAQAAITAAAQSNIGKKH